MTARDLIAILSAIPPDTPVLRENRLATGAVFDGIVQADEVMVHRGTAGQWCCYQSVRLQERNDTRAVVLR